ncbi:MAG TPA: ATP-binding cassette domain-containing protein [Vicinamibacterales bacterium]|nr:ATP-binding cassette domain-containing protein [Vicinamibacterales bacterium]
MITISGLTKTFEQRTALAGVDLSIDPGGSVAVSGPDREGRATLMQILATLIRPTSGTIVIGGLDAVTDVYRVRRLLAYAGPTRILPNRLRVDEYLRFVAGARHQPSAGAGIAADLVGLDRNAPIEALADEARGRLTLAAAIAAGAGLLLLDQPFDSLDTAARDRVCEWLVAARQNGTTVIVSDTEHVDGLCDRNVVLCDGRIVESAATAALDQAVPRRELVGA